MLPEQLPIEQQEAVELADEALEEAGLNKLRSLLLWCRGVCTADPFMYLLLL
jgi:hypothetical protein